MTLHASHHRMRGSVSALNIVHFTLYTWTHMYMYTNTAMQYPTLCSMTIHLCLHMHPVLCCVPTQALALAFALALAPTPTPTPNTLHPTPTPAPVPAPAPRLWLLSRLWRRRLPTKYWVLLQAVSLRSGWRMKTMTIAIALPITIAIALPITITISITISVSITISSQFTFPKHITSHHTKSHHVTF